MSSRSVLGTVAVGLAAFLAAAPVFAASAPASAAALVLNPSGAGGSTAGWAVGPSNWGTVSAVQQNGASWLEWKTNATTAGGSAWDVYIFHNTPPAGTPVTCSMVVEGTGTIFEDIWSGSGDNFSPSVTLSSAPQRLIETVTIQNPNNNPQIQVRYQGQSGPMDILYQDVQCQPNAASTANGADTSTATGAAFSDISGNQNASAITALAMANVINGTGSGLFSPNVLVTRAEMAKFVINLIGEGNIANALADQAPQFTDAASIPSWAWGYVNAAVDMGIIKGYPDGSFQPNGYVTDAEAAAMLLRAIGDDHPGVITGSWPGNYVAAALNLGLANNVSAFVANLPATRADIAQMTYNAGTVVPVAAGPDANGMWSTVGQGSRNNIGADAVVNGTVTGWGSSDIVINGTQYSLSSYKLLGTSDSVGSLQNQGVTALVSGTTVVYLAANSAITPTAGTLQCVNNDNNCSNSSGAIELSNGTVVDYQSGTTQYYVNVPSTGLLADGNASVPDQTYLSNGDEVTYTLDPANSDLASVTDTHATIVNGIVTNVCAAGASGCPAANSGGSTVVSVNYGPGTENVTVQPYTTVTLNGAASSASSLQNGDIVNVDIVGGSGTNGGRLGDGNATQIDATQNTASGVLSAYATNSSGAVTSLTVGGTQYATDAQFSGSAASADANLANTATVTLDSAGQVRTVSYTAFQGVLAVVSGYSETATVSGVTYSVALNSSGGSQTLTVPSADLPNNMTAGSAVVVGGTPVNPTFTVLTASGTATVTATSSTAAILNYNGNVVNDFVANSVFHDQASGYGYLGFGGLAAGDTVNVYTNNVANPFGANVTTILIDQTR